MAAGDWQGLIDTWILQPPCAVVLGYPSPKMVKDLSEADEARTKERKETLGDEWLKAKADALSAAQVKNAREIMLPHFRGADPVNLEREDDQLFASVAAAR